MSEVQTDTENRNTAIWKKLKLVEQLPKKDQKAILHHIDLAVKTQKYHDAPNKEEEQRNQS